jgi:hypothetical protein
MGQPPQTTPQTRPQTITIVGVFNTVGDAQRAIAHLQSAGFRSEDISIVAHKLAAEHHTSEVLEDAGIGAALGGVGGLLLSAAGLLTLPFVGPVIAAGPIAAVLAGAGIGAATGGIVGGLTEAGVSEIEAQQYAEGVRRGDVLVTVRTDALHAEKARKIMDHHGAIEMGRRVWNWRKRGWTGYQPDAIPYTREQFVEERQYATENRDTAREIPHAGEDDVSMAIEAMDRDHGIRPRGSRIYERKS